MLEKLKYIKTIPIIYNTVNNIYFIILDQYINNNCYQKNYNSDLKRVLRIYIYIYYIMEQVSSLITIISILLVN
jgi:hypothetical protein